jgi:2,4-dienoyl-CoA reductase-like NADH-dependent reductase (Old Yellow Enzyme family)
MFMAAKQEFKHLFEPHNIGNVEIMNRIVFQPHHPAFGSLDVLPTEQMMNYYIERAKGGTGLVVIEALAVHPSGQISPQVNCCVLATDRRIIPLFKTMTSAMHKYGTRVFAQLTHCGPNVKQKPVQISYSSFAIPEPGGRDVPKEIEIEELQEVVRGFGESAAVMRESGFDGVELKFAHDGLIRAFVSEYTNRRTDEYGGSYANRTRFFREIMAEIRRRVGDDYPVGARLLLDEFSRTGWSLDYSKRLAKTCEENTINYINGDSGGFNDGSMQIFPMCMPLGAGVYMASEIKKTVAIPVVAFGRINDPVLGEMVLEEGHADFVGMCRQLLCDPETANKAKEGRLDDIRHCIGCNDACLVRIAQSIGIRCIQNPAGGREKTLGIGTLKPAKNPKKIMVIGGGVSGMKFAEIAALRGHRVSLYEKSKSLGGQVTIAEKLPFRVEIAEVPRYLKIQLEQYRVPVYLNTAVDIKTIEKENPDIVVTATGSHPYMEKIPGSEASDIKILDVCTALLHSELIGHNVAVLEKTGHIKGGGIIEYTLALGAQVWCVTPFEQLCPDFDGATLTHLKRRLYRCENFNGVINEYDIKLMEKNALVLYQVYNTKIEKKLENIDTLIIADRNIADNELYKKLKAKGRKAYAIGDCVAPRKIEQGIYEAEILARKL